METWLLNEAIAFCRWMLPELAHPEAAKEEIKAAGECRAKERSPNPPKLRLSCAWSQLLSGIDGAKHEAKHCLTSSSKDFKLSIQRLGGVALAR